MRKKAYLRTIEVAFAVILTFIIAYFVLPRSITPQDEARISILPVLEQKPEFRNCVMAVDFNCTYALLREFVPSNYDFAFDITENPNTPHAGLPAKRINTESVYIAGNISMYSPKIVKLYYWRKD